jgi:hypothetical protein
MPTLRSQNIHKHPACATCGQYLCFEHMPVQVYPLVQHVPSYIKATNTRDMSELKELIRLNTSSNSPDVLLDTVYKVYNILMANLMIIKSEPKFKDVVLKKLDEFELNKKTSEESPLKYYRYWINKA